MINLRNSKNEIENYRKFGNNSNESGILIYNKVNKASSTTVATYMFKVCPPKNKTDILLHTTKNIVLRVKAQARD